MLNEMNGQTIKSETQKTRICWLAAVAGLLMVAACRAPAPQAGQYQWTIVPHENEADTVYVIDQGTGEAARWSESLKKWIPSDAMPDSLPDWKAIREMRAEQVKQRAEREKQEKEAREKRDALVKAYAKMPLEKQVAWANNISICKFRGRRYVGLRADSTSCYEDCLERFESLKGERFSAATMRLHPYKATDEGLVVWFNGMADGSSLEFGLSRTPIDSKQIFPAPETIIDDVKAEIKRQAEKREEAHAENH